MFGSTDLLHLSPAPHFKTFQVFLIYLPEASKFSALYTRIAILQMWRVTSFFLNSKSISQLKIAFFLLNAAFTITILDLISQVHLSSFVNFVPKYLKDSAFPSCFGLSYVLLEIRRHLLDILALSVIEVCSTCVEGIIDVGLVVKQGITF
jgi:hypothetical protein